MICVYIYFKFNSGGVCSSILFHFLMNQSQQLEWEETRLLGGADECQAVVRNHFLRLVCVCLFY